MKKLSKVFVKKDTKIAERMHFSQWFSIEKAFHAAKACKCNADGIKCTSWKGWSSNPIDISAHRRNGANCRLNEECQPLISSGAVVKPKNAAVVNKTGECEDQRNENPAHRHPRCSQQVVDPFCLRHGIEDG